MLLLLVGISHACFAQQFVLIKKGKIKMRYNLGEEIKFTLKDQGDQVFHTAILQIKEFEFITIQKDTIEYARISKLKFQNPRKKQAHATVIGSAALLALHFALKEPFGEKNPFAVRGLAYTAGLGFITAGLNYLRGRGTIKLNGHKRLKFINYDSPLYK